MEDVDALLLEARRRYELQRRGDNTLSPAQLPAWDELGDERRAALRALVMEEQMMQFAAFIEKYQGRFVDVDHAFGAQCVDLINAYVAEVLNEPRIPGNAIDIWRTASAEYQRVLNAPTNTPPRGAIVIWGQNAIAGTGVYGHIAIAVETQGVDTFTSFDQNWPTGSPCHLQRHTYDGAIGWLIPAAVHVPPSPTLPAKPGPPKTAESAVETLRRHAADLTDHPSVSDTNALLAAVRTWPQYDH